MPTTPAPAPDRPAEKRSTVRALLRLWPYVRPVRARLASAAVIAILASCVGLVIPLVLKWMVDGPVADRDPAGVWLGALYLLLLGVAEALLFGLRRWLVARPLSAVEAGMRADLYRHLQRLPVAFHDRWASGQLLSRGTTDLMLLRMFLAFPLTFLLVNGVTILVGVGIMLVQDWTLGLVILGPAIPVMITCGIFEKKYSAVARRAQDQVGDLTTVVEESVLGIRIIKGFGRHRSQARAFHELSHTLRGTELRKARLLASIWAVIVTLPELAIGAALVVGVVQVADGSLSAGTLVAFLSTALALRWPVESIGFLLAMSQEAATATDRYFEVMDAQAEEPGGSRGTASVSGGAGRRPAARGAARRCEVRTRRCEVRTRRCEVRTRRCEVPPRRCERPRPRRVTGCGSRGSGSGTPTRRPARRRCSTGSICTSGPGSRWPWSAPPAAARRRSPRWSPACTR